MAKSRSAWRRSKETGVQSCSLGERGGRVRIFQKRKDGAFYAEKWVRGVSTHLPLETTDRDTALKLGKKLYAELLILEESAHSGQPRLTLRKLWDRYRLECADFKDNKETTRNDTAIRAELLIAHFGDDFAVEDLTADHQREYEQARMSGGLSTRNGFISNRVGARSAQADVNVLHTMLKWATTVPVPGGKRLVDRHPLAGVKKLREKNPRRPAATYERYLATREWIANAAATADSTDEQMRWIRIDLALFLAEATGRRLNSIRNLRWEDISDSDSVVTWRADADKKGVTWKVQMPRDFMDGLFKFRDALGTSAGPMFAAQGSQDGLMDLRLFKKWLTVAEKGAGLPKLDGSLWHAYRRKWAIERKHLPIRDVAAAGGWNDVTTLLEVYQQADAKSILAVTSEAKKLYADGVA